MVFLWFSTLSALGRWLEYLRRPATGSRCPLPFSYGFPMVFHTFSPEPVAGVPPPARHRQLLPASIFLWFSCGFPHFQPWAGGWRSSAGPPPAAPARFHFPMVFLRFSTLSTLSRWLEYFRRPATSSRCPLPFSYGFPMVFLHFQPWAGGCTTSHQWPPAAAAEV